MSQPRGAILSREEFAALYQEKPCVNCHYEPAYWEVRSFSDGKACRVLTLCWSCWDEACEAQRRYDLEIAPQQKRISYFFELITESKP